MISIGQQEGMSHLLKIKECVDHAGPSPQHKPFKARTVFSKTLTYHFPHNNLLTVLLLMATTAATVEKLKTLTLTSKTMGFQLRSSTLMLEGHKHARRILEIIE